MSQTELNRIEFTADEQSSLTRLDKLLCSYLPDLTRSKITGLIEDGFVLVDGKTVSKNVKPRFGSVITVEIPPAKPYKAVAENIPIEVVYEDDDLIVVNKPKGMVVHPAHGNESGTLVNALLHHCGNSLSGINGIMRPGIVHRIDKDTSGLLVVAKNDIAHNGLAEQFKVHSILREYHAVVFGVLKQESGVIDKPIGRHPVKRKMMSCGVGIGNAKRAVTRFEVVDKYNGFTHVKCSLETGRTHQIRVHMSDMGHFVIGDPVYGRKIDKIKLDFDGQCLHAKTLGFIHPVTGKQMFFDSELPDYFVSLLKKISQL